MPLGISSKIFFLDCKVRVHPRKSVKHNILEKNVSTKYKKILLKQILQKYLGPFWNATR